jgi:hypothetical protein
MSKRSLAVLGVAAVSAAAVVLSTSPAFASSSDVLSYGAVNTGGTNVANADSLTGALAASTTSTFKFTSGGKSVTITCSAASMIANTTSNPTAPGTADLDITTLTFSDGASQCTIAGISGVTVSSIKINGTATATVTDGATPALNITALDERVALNNGLGLVNCDYGNTATEAAIVGDIVNPNSGGTGGSITFTSQTVHLLSGLSVCGASGSTGTFNAKFSGIVDSSGHGSNLAVYDN